jgi:hypothetical protein
MISRVFRDDLTAHLKQFSAAPFLFVGAGVGRRYYGLDGWEALLRRFAPAAGGTYEFYSASANGDPTEIASQIAKNLHEKWWNSDEYAESRERYEGKVGTDQSALKAEVARYVEDTAVEGLVDGDPYDEELDLLKGVVVDGIITTNYDPFLEEMFPGFRVFVGQDQLLFSDPQGVGEIYKVHGSCEEPDSLVLTTEDYAEFDKRNPYLAAKLLTIFVEHPVIFIGYSLGDPNVTRILRSIASVLTNDRIEQLQDRLIFIDWDPNATEEPVLAPSPFVTEGYNIPLRTAKVADYRAVFEALGSLERRLPARILRQLKQKVYDLVLTNDPKGRLFVVRDLDTDVDTDEVEVVFGVGAIEKITTSYKGIGRIDLLEDVINNGTQWDPARVVDEVLSPFPKNWHIPIYKYLRGANLLDKNGALKDSSKVDKRIVARVARGTKPHLPPDGFRSKAKKAVAAADDFAALVDNHEPDDLLMYVAMMPEGTIDPEALRSFLVEHRESQFVNGHALEKAQWAKGVCLYDWLKYGRQEAKPKRPRARRSKSAPAPIHSRRTRRRDGK